MISANKKIYHMGSLVNIKGDVSALCFKKPRAINLKKEGWVLRWIAVTCPKCLYMRDKWFPIPWSGSDHPG